MLALFASIGARLLEPWPLKFVIDRVVVTAPAGGASGWVWLDGLEPMTLLTYAAIEMLLIVATRGVGSYRSTVGFALVGNKVLTEVREDLYRHLQRLSLAFHHKTTTGDLTIRIIGDIGMLKQTTVTAILPLLANVLMLGAMVGIMLWLNLKLALIALSPLPLLWLTSLHFGRRIQEVSRKQRQREGAMASTAAESMMAIRDIQALSLEKNFEKAFTAESKKSLKEGVKAKRLAAGLEHTVDVLIGLSSALVLWFGARLVLTGVLTPGDLFVFLAYLKNTFRPIREFAKYTGRLAKATAAGERVAVVGPSGMGKSTLVSLLLRLHDPDEGRVLIDGVDIREFRLGSLRAQISIVLPDSLLFAASVRDNIGFGAPGACVGEIGRAARLAVARAALRRSPILILDEPTTALDHDNERVVIEALENLYQGRTVLIITHDLELASRADRIIYLEAGQILEQGTHAELIGRNDRYAA